MQTIIIIVLALLLIRNLKPKSKRTEALSWLTCIIRTGTWLVDSVAKFFLTIGETIYVSVARVVMEVEMARNPKDSKPIAKDWELWRKYRADPPKFKKRKSFHEDCKRMRERTWVHNPTWSGCGRHQVKGSGTVDGIIAVTCIVAFFVFISTCVVVEKAQ